MPSISAAARPTFARGGIGPPDYASLPRGPTKRCKNLSECRFRCRAGDRIGHGQTGGGGPFILAQEKDGKIRYCGFPSSPPLILAVFAQERSMPRMDRTRSETSVFLRRVGGEERKGGSKRIRLLWEGRISPFMSCQATGSTLKRSLRFPSCQSPAQRLSAGWQKAISRPERAPLLRTPSR